jgi:hypothetical protein
MLFLPIADESMHDTTRFLSTKDAKPDTCYTIPFQKQGILFNQGAPSTSNFQRKLSTTASHPNCTGMQSYSISRQHAAGRNTLTVSNCLENVNCVANSSFGFSLNERLIGSRTPSNEGPVSFNLINEDDDLLKKPETNFAKV